MADILLTFALMVLCLITEGFFSGSEIGVVSADRMKLRHDAAKGSLGAKLALEMLDRPEWLLSTTLVGTISRWWPIPRWRLHSCCRCSANTAAGWPWCWLRH
jgi:hypothetical protein